MKPPPLAWWRTVLFLVPTITLYTVALGVVSLAGSAFDRRGRFPHRCAQWWSKAILLTSGVRVERRGDLPANPGCIYVANHSSFYDIPILFTALPAQLRIVAKAGLGRVPFVGWHLRWAGHLLVDRQRPGAAVLKRMHRMAAQGASLIVFPEGSRTPDGTVGRFKGGVFLLALDTGLPIVPVTVSGSREVMPRGRFAVHPGQVRVTVHAAVATAGMPRDEARALAERVREVVASSL